MGNRENSQAYREGRAVIALPLYGMNGPSLFANDLATRGSQCLNAEHRMESEHDDDDRTLAETLLNIKRSVAKGKTIMQESEPPKKIKKKEMIQISLDEEFAKKIIPQEAKQIDEREKVINWNDPDVLSDSLSCVSSIQSPDTKVQSGQPVMTREEDDGISVALDPQV
ncbi:hypothetical protein Tco_0840251 [Tanacetum coccineum]|uniref:Uncharacterized protein n=1 Tax=Tanacetum coccineum TaxID=301880 RepID=A0ABQ5AXI7_9ASTR